MDNDIYIAGYSMAAISEVDEEIYNERINNSDKNYDIYNLVDSFHTEEFENMFKLNIPIILGFDAKEIIIICNMLINKINIIYNYNISPKPVFNNINDIIKFLDFVKFLEFDNVIFLSNVCIELDMCVDNIVNMVNITDNISKHSNIINVIDLIADKYKYNNYIYEFLLNYNKIDMIKWLNGHFINKKSDILAELV